MDYSVTKERNLDVMTALTRMELFSKTDDYYDIEKALERVWEYGYEYGYSRGTVNADEEGIDAGAEFAIRELIAVCNRDGGHLQREVGLEQAARLALRYVNDLRQVVAERG